MTEPEKLLQVAEQVADLLQARHIPTVVIGSVALAAHHYVRLTQDIDLGVTADTRTLQEVAHVLHQAGYGTEWRAPDADDPLGGVLDISGPFGLLQIINFAGRFPAVIEDSLTMNPVALRPGSPLKVVPLPHLVALKLYAGGLKSKSDIVELLRRNPGTDIQEIRNTCDRYKLPGLDEVLKEL